MNATVRLASSAAADRAILAVPSWSLRCSSLPVLLHAVGPGTRPTMFAAINAGPSGSHSKRVSAVARATSAATVAGAWRQNVTPVVYYDPELDLTVLAIRLARNPVGVEHFARSCGITGAGQRLIWRRVGALHQRTESATRVSDPLAGSGRAARHALTSLRGEREHAARPRWSETTVLTGAGRRFAALGQGRRRADRQSREGCRRRGDRLLCLRGSRGRAAMTGDGVCCLDLLLFGQLSDQLPRAHTSAGAHLRLLGLCPAHSAAVPRRLTSLSSGRLTRTISQISRPIGRSSSTTRPSTCTARSTRCA